MPPQFPSEHIRVFVSSTFSDLRHARETVAQAVLDMNAEPRLFPEQSLAGEATNAFIGVLEQAHVLVLLTTNPSPWVAQEIEVAETAGIPVLEFAEIRPDADGAGVRLTDHAIDRLHETTHFQSRWSTLADLRFAVQEALASLIARRFSGDVALRPVALDLYQTIGSYIGRARDRLAVVQDTSTLLLGPKRSRYNQELFTFQQMHNRIEELLGLDEGEGGVADATHLRLVHLFNQASTLRQLRQNPREYPDADFALGWIKDHATAIDSSDRISIVGCDARLTPFIIQDSMFAFPSWVDGHQFWHEQREAGRVATNMWAPVENAARRGRPATGIVYAAGRMLEESREPDQVLLIDDSAEPVRLIDKLQAHNPPGDRHLAVSVVIVDTNGQVLLQRRHPEKYHFGGRWSNACCSHPLDPNGLLEFAQERLRYEMGLDVALESRGYHDYVATDDETLRVERERTHVFFGVVAPDTIPHFREDEVQDFKWRSPAALEQQLVAQRDRYTPWLHGVLITARVLSASQPAD